MTLRVSSKGARRVCGQKERRKEGRLGAVTSLGRQAHTEAAVATGMHVHALVTEGLGSGLVPRVPGPG